MGEFAVWFTVILAIVLDVIVLGGFLWVKGASDPLVLVVATAVMAAILITEFFFLFKTVGLHPIGKSEFKA